MAKFLTNLVLDEISLVDEGANPEAHVAFFKRKGLDMNIDEIKKSLEKAEAENKVLKAENALTNDERDFYKSLSDADKTAFLSADAAVRKAKMGDNFKKSLSGDEAEAVTKKLADAEKAAADAKVEITKRDEAIAKRDEEISKLKGDVDNAALREEVLKSYPNSKGTIEEKVAVLKTIKATGDEAVRKSLLDTLARDEAAATAFSKEKGAGGGNGGDDAKTKLDNLAKGIVEKAKEKGETLTFEQGFAKALDTEDGRKLYKEING